MYEGEAVSPERRLVLSYAPSPARAGLTALMALDDRLGAIVRRASEPMIGLMRLTWWAEALDALDAAPPPPEPLLRALAAVDVRGAALARMTDGWEVLLGDEPLDDAALATFGRERGGRLFAAMAALSEADDPRVAPAGEGWALADLAAHLTDREAAARAGRMARDRLGGLFAARWPAPLRALGALALLARSDLAGGRTGAPGRVGRLMLHRLTGR